MTSYKAIFIINIKKYIHNQEFSVGGSVDYVISHMFKYKNNTILFNPSTISF